MIVVSTSEETPTVITTFFIRQQIDLGIHDILYQLSGQLAKNVKTYDAKYDATIQGIGGEKNACR